jgi:hypothetical protein
VEAEHLIPVAKDMFRSFLRIVFRHVHFFTHHESENFMQGMPTDVWFFLDGDNPPPADVGPKAHESLLTFNTLDGQPAD